MYELIQVGEKTYYIDCPSKIGIYRENDTDIYLIDSGNDKDTAKKINKIISANEWNLKAIINTHSHADHIGGNSFLQEKFKCPIFSVDIESSFINNTILEPSCLYGASPCKELKNKFLFAKQSISMNIDEMEFPIGLEFIRLDGHSFAMIGIKTCDDICFIADCITGENIIEKYHISFIYDVKAFLNSLDIVENINAKLFIPSHAKATEDIKPLVDINRKKTYEIINKLLEICKTPICFEDILKNIFDSYNLKMDFNQYVLVGSTIKSYLSYLHNENKISTEFVENKLFWKCS